MSQSSEELCQRVGNQEGNVTLAVEYVSETDGMTGVKLSAFVEDLNNQNTLKDNNIAPCNWRKRCFFSCCISSRMKNTVKQFVSLEIRSIQTVRVHDNHPSIVKFVKKLLQQEKIKTLIIQAEEFHIENLHEYALERLWFVAEFDRTITIAQARMIEKCLTSSATMTSLMIYLWDLQGEAKDIVLETIKQSTTLHHLAKMIDDDGEVTEVCEAIKQNESITSFRTDGVKYSKELLQAILDRAKPLSFVPEHLHYGPLDGDFQGKAIAPIQAVLKSERFKTHVDVYFHGRFDRWFADEGPNSLEKFLDSVKQTKTCSVHICFLSYFNSGNLHERGWTNERLAKLIDTTCETDAIHELTIHSRELRQGFLRYFLSRLGEMQVNRLNLSTASIERLGLQEEFWEALICNSCLDYLDHFDGQGMNTKQSELYNCLNEVGRLRLKAKPLNPKLWPLFLERASRETWTKEFIPSVIFHFVKHGLVHALSENPKP